MFWGMLYLPYEEGGTRILEATYTVFYCCKLLTGYDIKLIVLNEVQSKEGVRSRSRLHGKFPCCLNLMHFKSSEPQIVGGREGHCRSPRKIPLAIGVGYTSANDYFLFEKQLLICHWTLA